MTGEEGQRKFFVKEGIRFYVYESDGYKCVVKFSNPKKYPFGEHVIDEQEREKFLEFIKKEEGL